MLVRGLRKVSLKITRYQNIRRYNIILDIYVSAPSGSTSFKVLPPVFFRPSFTLYIFDLRFSTGYLDVRILFNFLHNRLT